MIKKYFALIFVMLLLLQLSLVIAESGSTQNVVNTASAQITPPATEYTQKTSDVGYPELFDANGNLVARGDEHFQLTQNKGQITFKDNGAGQAGEELEFGNFAQDKTIKVSNTGLFSEVTYNPEEKAVSLNDKSTADIYVGGTELKQVTNAEIIMSGNGSIDYASFTSKNGGSYIFYYQGKDYTINANAGDKVVFDPRNNKLTGSSTSGKDMNFGLGEGKNENFPYLSERTGSIKAKDFEITLNENGGIKEVNLPNGGTYQDKANKLDYSSLDKFSVFYDGKDIKNYEGNAVSVFSDEEGLSVQAKGLVNVNDLDKKILYQGKTAGVYSEYDYDTSNFDVQAGEASVSNGKHKVEIKNGIGMPSDNLEYSGKEASPFSVSYSKDGNNKESLLVNYLEKDGKIQTEAIYFKDGKENIVDLGSLADQEQRYAERAKLPTRADIDKAIFELDTSDPQYDKKLAELYSTKGLMAEQELSSYKVGQEVFEVSEGHMRSLGKIAKINDDGTFVLEGGYYYNVQDIGDVSGESMTLSKSQLDKLQVSKLGIGQEVGETTIKDIEYDSNTKQIKYLFENGQEGLEKQTVLDYFSEDYKTAISYYQEAQKNPQLAGEASLGLASVYQQMGDTGSARKEYLSMTLDENLDAQTKSLAYKGLIANYFQENKPGTALYTTFKAVQEFPNDVALVELNKQLTKNYLETISSAINTEDADILGKWKEKVGFGEKWYNVGLDQPIVSWFKEDINFATGFSRDQLSEQQKGILVMENLLDRGYSLKDIQGMNANQVRDIFKIQSAEAVGMTNAIKTAFSNSDVQNLANGAKYTFDFETGTGYVDKEFLEKGLAEKVLSGVNTKNVAIYLATEGVGYGVAALRPAAGATTALAKTSTGFWNKVGYELTRSRYVANLFPEGSTAYYRAKVLTSDVFLELPANLKQLSVHNQNLGLIKSLASESEASLGTASLANTRIPSLDFKDRASFLEAYKANVGSGQLIEENGIRLVRGGFDNSASQALVELNGQKFLMRVAGQDLSGALQSQLLLAPATEPLLLTEGSYASGRYLLNSRNRVYNLDQLKTGEFNVNQVGTVLDDLSEMKPLSSEGVFTNLKQGSLVPKSEQGFQYRIDNPEIYTIASTKPAIRDLFSIGKEAHDGTSMAIMKKVFEFKPGIVPFSKTCNLQLGECVESSILYQLSAQAQGYRSYIVSGTIGDGEGVVPHAFNIIYSGDKPYLVDVVNPVMTTAGMQDFVVPITGINKGVIQFDPAYKAYVGNRVYNLEFNNLKMAGY